MTTTDGSQRAVLNSSEPSNPSVPDYRLTELESPFVLTSLIRQILQRLREPKLTVPQEYYRGEATLPVVEMRPWYRDLPNLYRALVETSNHPIDVFNRGQEKKRALVAALIAFVAGIAGWALVKTDAGVVLAPIGGVAVGRLVSVLVFKKREFPPDIWQEYKQQRASWINSLLVHAVALAALILPFYIARMLQPVKASP